MATDVQPVPVAMDCAVVWLVILAMGGLLRKLTRSRSSRLSGTFAPPTAEALTRSVAAHACTLGRAGVAAAAFAGSMHTHRTFSSGDLPETMVFTAAPVCW